MSSTRSMVKVIWGSHKEPGSYETVPVVGAPSVHTGPVLPGITQNGSELKRGLPTPNRVT